MSEELKNEIIENPAGEETELPAAQEPVTLQVAVPTAVTMWNDPKLMNMSFRTARMLSCSALVPDSYKQSPENCLVAIDIANRMGVSPLMVMQNLYVVKGKHEYMIPAVKQFILATDMEKNEMQVKLIEGMRSDEN